MNVVDMLKMMALLSVGTDALTPKTEDIFLKYLNVANMNIFNKTASLNPDLLTSEEVFTVVGGGNSNRVFLSQKPFMIAHVLIDLDPLPLTLIPYSDLLVMNRRFREKGQPRFFTFRKESIFLYPFNPKKSHRVVAYYVQQPAKLRINTKEADIPVPISFHNLLVDEALYYLFLDEEGFKSPQRAVEAKARATELKNDLISYLYGNTNQSSSITTFSNI